MKNIGQAIISKRFLLCFSIIFILFAFAVSAQSTDHSEADSVPSHGSILIFLRHGRSYDWDLALQELQHISDIVTGAGYIPVTASIGGKTVKRNNTEIRPDIAVETADLDNYQGIIIPCLLRGSTAENWHARIEEIELVTMASESGIPIAAQHGGVVILAEAGLLEGKKFAYYPDDAFWNDEYFSKGLYVISRDVIRADNLITSGPCLFHTQIPGQEAGTEEMMKLFFEAVEEVLAE
jgi:putative intracellular protease/amidase